MAFSDIMVGNLALSTDISYRIVNLDVRKLALYKTPMRSLIS